MRQIYKVSLVFRLRDMLTKLPITKAIIFLNGKILKHVQKNDGHYVFCDLPFGVYDVNIIRQGYLDLNFKADLNKNKAVLLNLNLPYKINNLNIIHVPRFEITVLDKNIPLGNKDIILVLKNKLNFLKILNPIEKNTSEIAIAAGFNINFADQNYIYKTKGKEYNFFFNGYNPDNRSYILKDAVQEKINSNGTLMPCWKIKTDEKGRAILPIFFEFMKEAKLKFELKVNNEKVNLTGNASEIENKIIYLKAKIK